MKSNKKLLLLVTSLFSLSVLTGCFNRNKSNNSDDGDDSAQVEPKVLSLKLYAGDDLIVKGKTLALAAVVETQGSASKLANFVSSDPSVATVDESGVVTGHKLGNTTIIATAKDGTGVFGTIRVDVIKLATSVEFNISEVTMDINDTLVLTPVFEPIDTSNEIVIWSSSDEEVAMVKTSGIVYARKSGECDITITTTDGTNLSATCHITVQ